MSYFFGILFLAGFSLFAVRKGKLKMQQKKEGSRIADLKQAKERKQLCARVLELGKDDVQKPAILYVVTCFEKEKHITVTHVKGMLSYFKKCGIRGSDPDFRDLFSYLHEGLIQTGCFPAAELLCKVTCLQFGK
jgi:hypothetical protein